MYAHGLLGSLSACCLEYFSPGVVGYVGKNRLGSKHCRSLWPGLNDLLAFYQCDSTPLASATKVQIAAYIADLRQRSHPKGANIRHLHSDTGLAQATIYQRVTVVRLFFDYLTEIGFRENTRNPVGRGKYLPGKTFVSKKERGLISPFETQFWLLSDEEWDHILAAAGREPIRNQLMLLLAYDGALRRSELVALEIRDLALPLQQLPSDSKMPRMVVGVW